MSIAAISWVFKQEIKPSSLKFVLVALADCADTNGICWPSIDHITETTCQDRKTVIKSLDDLESRGWLVDTGKRMGRTNQVKVYRLTDDFFKSAPTTDCGKGSENGTVKESRSSAETVPYFPAKSTENGFPPTPPYRADPLEEPSMNLGTNGDGSSGSRDYPPDFLNFFKIYPPNICSAHEAARAYEKARANGATQSEILAGAKAYFDHLVSKENGLDFVTNAAKWLREKSWTVDYGRIAAAAKSCGNHSKATADTYAGMTREQVIESKLRANEITQNYQRGKFK